MPHIRLQRRILGKLFHQILVYLSIMACVACFGVLGVFYSVLYREQDVLSNVSISMSFGYVIKVVMLNYEDARDTPVTQQPSSVIGNPSMQRAERVTHLHQRERSDLLVTLARELHPPRALSEEVPLKFEPLWAVCGPQVQGFIAVEPRLHVQALKE